MNLIDEDVAFEFLVESLVEEEELFVITQPLHSCRGFSVLSAV